jgi:hypothetical protein
LGLGPTNDWFRSFVTFERVVREMGGIPSGTGAMIKLNMVYFNIGGMNYIDNPNVIEAQYKQAVQNAAVLAQQLGAFGGYNKATNSWNATCRFCPMAYGPTSPLGPESGYFLTPGLYGRFPIILTPTFGDTVAQLSGTPAVMTEIFFTACQLSKACIAVAQYSGTDEWMKCRPQPVFVTDPLNPLAEPTVDPIGIPPECTKAVDPTLAADKRRNGRRFDFGFTALPSQAAMLSQMVSWLKLKNAQTAVLFISSHPTYASQVLPAGLENLRANKIALVMPHVLLAANGGTFNEEEIATYSSAVIGHNPDLFICVAHMLTPGDPLSCTNLLKAFRTARWMPKAVIIPGGGAAPIAQELNIERPGDGGQ